MIRRGVSIFVVLAALVSRGGGGPQNVLIVVNDNSPASLELGSYYAARREIPERQICHVSVTTNDAIDWPGFTNDIRAPVMRYLGTSGLSNQIDYIVFARDIPHQVYTNNYSENRLAGLTATMFYGLYTSPDVFSFGCDLAAGSSNPYFAAERSFRHADAPSGNKLYLSTLLTAYDLDTSKRLADRGAASDGSAPSGQFHFMHTSDVARNVQWPAFDAADFLVRSLSPPLKTQTHEADALGGVTNVAGYLTGLVNVPDVALNTYLPGAYGEHLTSYGGRLFDPFGQMSILSWITAGCSGSYGTVVEPCNYTDKFTDPSFAYWYARGFNLAESQFMSVRNPYQGVLVADPLAAPYATNLPRVALGGIAANAVVSNTVTISVTGTAVAVGARVSRLDLFLDGAFLATLTNVAPTFLNTATIAAGSVTSSYTVALGDDLYAVARGLALSVNLAGGNVRATNSGDRVMLTYTNWGKSGASILCSAATATGLASSLTIDATALTGNFLDPVYPAREYISLRGVANTGDFVTLTITLTNGVAITNEIVANDAETATSVMQRLMNAVNANPTLQATNGIAAKFINNLFGGGYVESVLECRTPGPGGWNNLVDYSITPAISGSGLSNSLSFADHINDNADVLRARGTVLLTAGLPTLTASYSLNTTTLPDGPHSVMAIAYNGSAVAEQGRTTVPFTVSNRTISTSLSASALNVPRGNVFTATVTATTASGAITQLVLLVEGKTNAISTSSPASFAVATTNLGAGFVTVQALVRATGGTAALSAPVSVALFTDRDSDGMSDQWEFAHLGSETNATGSGDADGDGVSNADEYFADTDPTNVKDYLRFTGVSVASNLVELVQPSRTTRVYRLSFANDLSGVWQPLTTNFYIASTNVLAWSTPATNAPLFHRVEVRVP